MSKHKKAAVIISLIVVCCALMSVVDGIIRPSYTIKSAIKIVLFLLCPLIYTRFCRDASLKRILKPNKKGILYALLLGIGVYAVIIGAFFTLRNVFDFSNITNALVENAGVTVHNFVWVALYISLANSLLEEFFFRGFAFLTLKNLLPRKFAYIFSSVLFAAYHMAMITGWFSIGAFLLAMAGLTAGAVIFNNLNEKYDNIYSSWIVHLFANLATNTVGFILFGMI